ncbi:hypothetical protein [Microbulbifer variabilis]|uniref:hypothetical protein n=1 Tax=Microbulbifer variabilis TaxID=266805 RepID=UPI001CFE5C85|nr:hypothetical protein [Microbulbifer variabilis]
MISPKQEKPILFNAQDVRAILDGRKTQTRRLIKPQPFNGVNDEEAIKQMGGLPAGRSLYQEINSAWQSGFVDINCSYGEPGDRLWVRETFGYEVRSLGGSPHEQIVYRASKPDAVRCYDCNGMEQPIKWKPSIHMPRWASRITLEITNVRVERIQGINGDDAIAEGIQSWIDSFKARPTYHQNSNLGGYPVTAFSRMWKSIYGDDYWDKNPWVWVIEFRRVERAEVAA